MGLDVLTEDQKDRTWEDIGGYFWIWVDNDRTGESGWCCLGKSLRGEPDDYYYPVLELHGENSSGPYREVVVSEFD